MNKLIVGILVLILLVNITPSAFGAAGNKGNFKNGYDINKIYDEQTRPPYTHYYTYIQQHRPKYYRDSQGHFRGLDWFMIAGPDRAFIPDYSKFGYFNSYPLHAGMSNYNTSR